MTNTYYVYSRDFSFKSIDGNYIVKGYISTDDIDLINDIATQKGIQDMVEQIKSKNIKLDYEHEAFKGDSNIEQEAAKTKMPLGRITNANIDKKGLYVEAELNPNWKILDENGNVSRSFEEIWNSIESKMLDAFSIAFVPIETKFQKMGEKTVRLLDKINLLNVALTGNPINPNASMTEYSLKSAMKKGLEQKECEEDLIEIKASWKMHRVRADKFVETSWESPDMEDFQKKEDYFKAHLLWKTDNPQTTEDVALPIARPISRGSSQIEVPYEALNSANDMVRRVSGVTEEVVKQVQEYLEDLRKNHFPKREMLSQTEEKMAEESINKEEEKGKAETQNNSSVEEVKSELDGLRSEITEIKSLLSDLKSESKSSSEENKEETKSQNNENWGLSKEEVNQIKSLLEQPNHKGYNEQHSEAEKKSNEKNENDSLLNMI